MSDPYTIKFQCGNNQDGTYSPSHPYIRKAYCPTTYFNASSPDQYTYLQYWRRRMCYNTYLSYNNPRP